MHRWSMCANAHTEHFAQKTQMVGVRKCAHSQCNAQHIPSAESCGKYPACFFLFSSWNVTATLCAMCDKQRLHENTLQFLHHFHSLCKPTWKQFAVGNKTYKTAHGAETNFLSQDVTYRTGCTAWDRNFFIMQQLVIIHNGWWFVSPKNNESQIFFQLNILCVQITSLCCSCDYICDDASFPWTRSMSAPPTLTTRS